MSTRPTPPPRITFNGSIARPETAFIRAREQTVTDRQAASEPGRDPIDTFGVARARGRLRELDEWIAGVSPAGSREVLESYELERRQLREWLARGGGRAAAVFLRIGGDL